MDWIGLIVLGVVGFIGFPLYHQKKLKYNTI
jgi:hypothetical protein